MFVHARAGGSESTLCGFPGSLTGPATCPVCLSIHREETLSDGPELWRFVLWAQGVEPCDGWRTIGAGVRMTTHCPHRPHACYPCVEGEPAVVRPPVIQLADLPRGWCLSRMHDDRSTGSDLWAVESRPRGRRQPSRSDVYSPLVGVYGDSEQHVLRLAYIEARVLHLIPPLFTAETRYRTPDPLLLPDPPDWPVEALAHLDRLLTTRLWRMMAMVTEQEPHADETGVERATWNGCLERLERLGLREDALALVEERVSRLRERPAPR